jgi:hypothetical protein
LARLNTNSKTKNVGYEEVGFTDAKGKDKYMICTFCYQSNMADNRLFMKCDECNATWHLDCINPPPAYTTTFSKSRPYFRCPYHFDRDIKMIGNNGKPDLSGRLRLHKLRKLANPRTVFPYKNPGPRNNGIIDVELDPEYEDLERQPDGVVFKLDEQTIKLNFIEKTRR